MINIRYILIVLTIGLIFSCHKESLDPNSVVERNRVIHTEDSLSRWIYQEFIDPYNIDIIYRWDGSQSLNEYKPPKLTQVKPILSAIKYIWLDLYEEYQYNGVSFFKDRNRSKLPLRIYLHGNEHVGESGIPIFYSRTAVSDEFHIYGVDKFDSSNTNHIYMLARSLHHQYAQKLGDIYGYDRDQFIMISSGKYYSNLSDIASSMQDLVKISSVEPYKMQSFAHKRGFMTMYGMLSAGEDFAEMVSILLTSTPREISVARKDAATPKYDVDPIYQQKYQNEADLAAKALEQKIDFVEQFYTKRVGLSLSRLQLSSLKRIKEVHRNV